MCGGQPSPPRPQSREKAQVKRGETKIRDFVSGGGKIRVLGNQSFNRETAQFFYFLDGFSETRSIEIGGFTCFWGKNLKPVVVSLKPEILAKPKFSGFNEYHHGVSSFYPQNT